MSESGVTGQGPMKPPRGQKLGRETGILMTVIKALLSTASAAERDGIKTTVEQEYKNLDKNLDGLILKKQGSLNTVMQTFRHICTEIESAKERVSDVKSNLQKCKMLLHCRREELERLWLEGLEHKHALEILEQMYYEIDHIRSVPQQFNKAMTRKQYLLACETLMTAVNCWNEELDYIEGLRELKTDLKAKREKLYQVLLEEMNTQIFLKSAPSVIELKRQGSGVFSPFQRSSSDRNSSGRTRMNQIKARKVYLDVTIQNVHNHQGSSVPQDDEMNDFIENILKCVVELKVLPKFKEDLKSQLEEKLLAAMNNISQQIIDYSDSNAMSELKNTVLSDFLQLTFNHFRLIVKYHLKILSLFESAEKRSTTSKNQISITKSDIWGQVQTVLQSSLKLYFDLGDSKEMSSGTTSFRNDVSSVSSLDVNSYFLKKRQPRQKKVPLFKFEYSLHGLNHVGEVGLEQEWMENSIDKHRFLVCKPNPKNIILIYNVIQEFILEIEDALEGSKCELRKFMDVNVNRIFVQQIYKEISEAIDLSRRNTDCWKEVISIDEAKRLGSPRPILQGVALIGRSVLDILSLAKDLPSHSEQLLRILDPVLTSYRESCYEIYGNILRAEEKRIISATMVGDEDIERLLKSLPNWTKLQERKEKQSERIDESPEDVRSQNVRESDLFVGLFGGKTVRHSDIVGDTRFLEQLSRFHESMEWMSETIRSISTLFQNQFQKNELTDQLQKIHSLAQLYLELGDMCLLMLYLEIRVHAFYYLSPIPQKADFAPGVDSQVPDPEVLQLSKDLTEMETVLTASLQPIKVQYVFEGLGQLISTVFIRGALDLRRINDNGVKRMCRNIFHIQQTVSSITKLAEVGLDQARDFYELFLHPIHELFDKILEKGPQFRELDYMNAVQLLYRSKPGSAKEPLNDYLTRLSNILGDVGVTV